MLHLCAIINQPFLEQEIHTEKHTWHTYGFFRFEHLNNVKGKLSLSICSYLLNGNSSCFPRPGAPQQSQGWHKVSLVTVSSLSRLCHTWEHPFKQLLGEVIICPRYFQNRFTYLYKHESAYIQTLGKYRTCQAQTQRTSDRSPFELSIFFFFSLLLGSLFSILLQLL